MRRDVRRDVRGERREARGARREARGARREARGARRVARSEARQFTRKPKNLWGFLLLNHSLFYRCLSNEKEWSSFQDDVYFIL